MKLACYLRVSSTRQAKESESIAGQRYQIEQWAIREGHELVAEFCDEGISAYNGTRPAFNRMLNEATSDSAQFEGIVVYNLSRFSRNVSKFLNAKEKLDEAEIRLLSVNEQIPQDRKTERLMTAICGAINENQSEQNSETVKDRLTETARQGYFCGGKVPYGYVAALAPRGDNEGKKERKVLILNTEEAKVIKRIFKMSLSGNNGLPMGLKRIASQLNEEGVTFRGNKWSFNKIDKILRDSTYCGEKVFGKRRNKNDPRHPPIIIKVPQIVSKEVFNAVGDGLTKRRPGTKATRGPFNSTMLSGILVCAKCGCNFRLTTGKSGRYHYYSCSQKVTAHVKSCDSPRIPREKLENSVVLLIKQLLLEESRLNRITEYVCVNFAEQKKKSSQTILKIDKELSKLNAKLSNLYSLLSEEKISLDETLNDHISVLRKQIKVLQSQRESVERAASSRIWNYGREQIKLFIENSFQILASNNHNAIKAYLSSIVSRIEVYPKTMKIVGMNYALVDKISKTKKVGTSSEVPTSLLIWRRVRDSNPRWV